ncbi:DUF6377 domain-containing protein [Parabacteroides sp. PF5-6]|uniref:DUF6377 domain-containing protein n=1 Tax=Parabacteroides sp. PF5-6 TaxID=1742403 RepID=UPI0024064539|nr:DUF6377 domain-containing protein [Parabacteroides sp. PF5-6]MDF9828693.1 cell division protein FtsB [Parabacteroides sp. PF5-6]
MGSKNRNRSFFRTYFFLFLFCLANAVWAHAKDELKAMSDDLTYIINNKEIFNRQKEQRINSLKKLLEAKDASREYVYEINRQLTDEYKKFKLDSAICYAEKNIEISRALNDSDRRYLTEIKLATLYSYAGRFFESKKILDGMHARELPEKLLPDYYEAYSRFHEHYGAMSNQSKYREVELYRDSLLAVLDTASFAYKINIAHRYLDQRKTIEAQRLLTGLLETEEADTPEYALITHYLGAVAGRLGQRDAEKKYFILSAITDARNSIRENTSYHRLARIYYNSGDISKAFLYAQSAIEDAVSSGVQFRTAQMSEFYSIINASYQLKEAKTNATLKRYLSLISILSVFLILLVLYIYKQMKKLSRVKEELSQTNQKLLELNLELNEANSQLNDKNVELSESNYIKEQYIAQFFDLCSAYIDKMEENRKTLYRLGINRQYEELMKRLKSTSAVDKELDELYMHFDSIFLSLYPTFVADFNALLAAEEQINLKNDDLLNKELRIYALLRLGITDSTKIAGFLRCSMSTVYNYRTKMRNKAAINREAFEDRVMKIGMTNRQNAPDSLS